MSRFLARPKSPKTRQKTPRHDANEPSSRCGAPAACRRRRRRAEAGNSALIVSDWRPRGSRCQMAVSAPADIAAPLAAETGNEAKQQAGHGTPTLLLTGRAEGRVTGRTGGRVADTIGRQRARCGGARRAHVKTNSTWWKHRAWSRFSGPTFESTNRVISTHQHMSHALYDALCDVIYTGLGAKYPLCVRSQKYERSLNYDFSIIPRQSHLQSNLPPQHRY